MMWFSTVGRVQIIMKAQRNRRDFKEIQMKFVSGTAGNTDLSKRISERHHEPFGGFTPQESVKIAMMIESRAANSRAEATALSRRCARCEAGEPSPGRAPRRKLPDRLVQIIFREFSVPSYKNRIQDVIALVKLGRQDHIEKVERRSDDFDLRRRNYATG